MTRFVAGSSAACEGIFASTSKQTYGSNAAGLADEIDICSSPTASENESELENSETETESESDQENSTHATDLTSMDGSENTSDTLETYRGFQMQYPKRTKRSRNRKLRPTNYEKGTNKPLPPSGKKTSQQKVYNDPVRVTVLIKLFDKNRIEKKINKKAKTVTKINCTPEPFINSAGMLFCNCCPAMKFCQFIEVQSVLIVQLTSTWKRRMLGKMQRGSDSKYLQILWISRHKHRWLE